MPPFRRAPGRPRKGEDPAPTRLVHVKVPEEMLAELEANAARRHITRHQALREAIALWNEAMKTLPERKEQEPSDP